MRRIASARITRVLVPVLIGAFVGPVVLGPAGVVLAQAPEVPKTKVAVIDFEVEGAAAGRMLARNVTDEVVLALIRSGSFEVTPRDEFYEVAKSLGLQAPFSTYDLVNIGKALEISAVVVGKVTEVRMEKAPRQAAIGLQVLAYDVVAQEYVLGASVTGEGRALPGYVGPDDPLLRDAIRNACDKATTAMAAQRTRLFTVGMVDDTGAAVVPNAGRQEGVSPGQIMAVLRLEWDTEKNEMFLRKLGRVTVVEVTAHDCTARPVEAGLRLMNGDKLRLIYREPAEQKKVDIRSKRRQINTWVLTAALLLLIATVTHESKGFQKGAQGLVAAAWTQGDAVRLMFTPGSVPTDQGITASYVLGYEVHRSTMPDFVPSDNSLIDLITIPGVTYYTDTTDEYALTATWTANDDGTVDLETTTETVDVTPTTALTTTDYTGTAVHTPIAPGTQYYYCLRMISRRVRVEQPPEGGLPIVQVVRSDPSRVAGPVTPLMAAQLVAPPNAPLPGSTDINTSQVTVSWRTSAGADAYEVQFSRVPTFPVGPQTWSLARDGGGPFYTTLMQGDQEVQRTFNISSKFPLRDQFGQPLPSFMIFWRVGAARSLDQSPPSPDGYVFGTEVRSFTTAELPPLPNP
jgi:hypothetical protein